MRSANRSWFENMRKCRQRRTENGHSFDQRDKANVHSSRKTLKTGDRRRKRGGKNRSVQYWPWQRLKKGRFGRVLLPNLAKNTCDHRSRLCEGNL